MHTDEFINHDCHVQVLSMYLHRYLRLTPALGILMCFRSILPLYMTSGPWAATKESLKVLECGKYWWYNILYINNFNVSTIPCIGHNWYLANDMQFFLLSPIFLYAFKVRSVCCHFPMHIIYSGISLQGTRQERESADKENNVRSH